MKQVRLKDVVVINANALTDSTPEDFSFRYVDIGSVSQGLVSIPTDEMSFGSAPSRARRLAEAGDTIVSTVRTYLRAVAAVPKTDEPLVFSTGFAVLHPKREIDGRYLSYYCQSGPFVDEVVARSVGVSYPAINPGEIGNFLLDLPTLEDQRRIADFLDAETVRVDRLVGLRQAQERLLGDESALLASFFERPPQNSREVPVKHLTTLITSGPRGWGEYLAPEGSPFVRITNVSRRGIHLDLRDLATVQAPDGSERERSNTRNGDVLVSITADLGSVGVVEGDASGGNVSQHLALLRPNRSRCVPEWLAWAIKSPRANRSLLSSGYGGTKQGLGLGDVANLRLAVPSVPEQGRIAREIGARCDVTTQLLSALSRGISLISERRAAVITAAVSGQLDATTARGAA